MPWYIPGNATKTYMAAELDSSVYGTIKTQARPAVFWRKSLENAYIFCVNGDYLSDTGGFGILNAILYELKDYAVTPVVNAQTVSIINYPVLAFEQEDAMDAGYSRNTASVLENVIWPDISTLSEYLNSRFTFLFTPQFHYQDETSRYRRNWSIFSACYMKNSLKPGCLPQEIRIPPSAKSCKKILLFTALFYSTTAFFLFMQRKVRFPKF